MLRSRNQVTLWGSSRKNYARASQLEPLMRMKGRMGVLVPKKQHMYSSSVDRSGHSTTTKNHGMKRRYGKLKKNNKVINGLTPMSFSSSSSTRVVKNWLRWRASLFRFAGSVFRRPPVARSKEVQYLTALRARAFLAVLASEAKSE